MGYHLYFQFTINSENRILEPNLPGLDRRLKQLQRLCDQFGPRAVNWRFDPICFYRSRDDRLRSNLDEADRIAASAAGAGIHRCTTSIMDPYAKVRRRTARLQGFSFVDPPREDKIRALLDLERMLAAQRIRLFTCCESELLRALPAHSSIRAGACIPSELFMELYGGTLSAERDGGQRVIAGCGCRVSVDIGSYDGQRCRHDCLYCYASPTDKRS
jgi:DNA repair photolyase